MATTLSEQAKQYQDENQIQDDASAKALREQNYKDYFNQQLQLAAAKQLGDKYFQESMNRQGMGTSGQTDTSRAIANNAYMNRQQTNLGNYQSTEAQITADNATRWQNEQASKDSNFITQLNSIGESTMSTSEKNALIDKLLENYGYASGNASSAVQSAIDTARAQVNSSVPSGADSSWYNDANALTEETDIKSSLSNWGKATEAMLKNNKKYGPDMDGGLFILQNNNSERAYVYYSGGKYYRISEEQAKSLANNGAKQRLFVDGTMYQDRNFGL